MKGFGETEKPQALQRWDELVSPIFQWCKWEKNPVPFVDAMKVAILKYGSVTAILL
jgi:hypothetical protein